MTAHVPEKYPNTELTLPAAAELKLETTRTSHDEFAEKFWARVDQSGDGCWPWTAGRFDSGAGAVWVDGKARKAHRIAWILTNGPLADRELICHKCDNPVCCRPDHLFVGSHRDNTQDMLRKGRGNRDGKRHLTPEQVMAIRDKYAAGGVTLKSLGDEYGVSFVAIHLAVTRKTWADIP